MARTTGSLQQSACPSSVGGGREAELQGRETERATQSVGGDALGRTCLQNKAAAEDGLGQRNRRVSRTTTHSPHTKTELETSHMPSLWPSQNTPCRACGPDGGLGDRDSQLSPPTDTPTARVFTPRMGVAVDREVLRPVRLRPGVVDPDADAVEPLPGVRRAGVAGVTHEVPPKRLTGRSRGPGGSRQGSA